MTTLIDGRKTAAGLRARIQREVAGLDPKPGLAVVIVGEDEASRIYVRRKIRACEETGITSVKHALPEGTSEAALLALIEKLNRDPAIDAILVQLPLPERIDEKRVIEAVLPEKDVDGFHPLNAGRLLRGEPCLQSCTPKGIMRLLEEYGIELRGKKAVVIGRSNIVGKPIAQLLLDADATVTVCHSRTRDLAAETKEADILIAAVGKRHLVTKEMVKEGAVVIDVGMNRDGERLCGDVDFENVKGKCSAITPVPGGVGPMTIACLLENTLLAYRMRREGGKKGGEEA